MEEVEHGGYSLCILWFQNIERCLDIWPIVTNGWHVVLWWVKDVLDVNLMSLSDGGEAKNNDDTVRLWWSKLSKVERRRQSTGVSC